MEYFGRMIETSPSDNGSIGFRLTELGRERISRIANNNEWSSFYSLFVEMSRDSARANTGYEYFIAYTFIIDCLVARLAQISNNNVRLASSREPYQQVVNELPVNEQRSIMERENEPVNRKDESANKKVQKKIKSKKKKVSLDNSHSERIKSIK